MTDDKLEASTIRWMRWGAVLMVLFALAFPFYRVFEPAAREDAREAHASHLAAQGRNLYRVECAECHGVGDELGDAPTLNSKQFLSSVTDEQISQLIAVGIPGSDMAAYSLDYGGTLTRTQITAITAYLRSLQVTAPDLPEWRDPSANV